MDNCMRVGSLLDQIGNTPLVALEKLSKCLPFTLYAKVEYFNPGQSMKDRIALYIIEKAEKEGKLKPGGTVVETTSGNTGFSMAMVSAIKGYKCKLAVNSKCAKEKIKMLELMGAEVHVCPCTVPPEHPDSYYSTGKRLGEETPNSIYVNQYFNPLNPEAYYHTLGPEIWKQTEGKVTHLFACSGTGGTLSGTAQYLKEQNPKVEVIGVDAVGSILKKYKETGEVDPNELQPYRMEGVGKNLVPGATHFEVIDRFVKVNDYESAEMTRALPLIEGILAGYSSGAALCAVIKEAGKLGKNAVPVVILPDHGSRYMTKVYEDQWMAQQEWGYDISDPVKTVLKHFGRL